LVHRDPTVLRYPYYMLSYNLHSLTMLKCFFVCSELDTSLTLPELLIAMDIANYYRKVHEICFSSITNLVTLVIGSSGIGLDSSSESAG
jgi:hypothetical protein